MEFGLIGKTLKYSESKNLFNKYYVNFQLAKLHFYSKKLGEIDQIDQFNSKKNYQNSPNYNFKNDTYSLFEIQNIDEVQLLLKEHQNLKGFNVTIPYKQDITKFLYSISDDAKSIGAVNCVKVVENKLYGYNTDWIAFMMSLQSFNSNKKSSDNFNYLADVNVNVCGNDFNYLSDVIGFASSFFSENISENKINTLKSKLLFPNFKNALILGTGGAAKAVANALKTLNVDFKFASRTPNNSQEISYKDIDNELTENVDLIINATPCGTDGLGLDLDDVFDFNLIPENIYLYDLVYNPILTPFLLFGRDNKRCKIKNGYEMLSLQAFYSWFLWSSDC